MKRIFIMMFVVTALVVLAIVFHQDLLAAADFIYERPYKSLSDRELDRRIAAVSAKIAQLDRYLDTIPQNPAERSLSEHTAVDDIRRESQGPLQARRQLLAERAWRMNRRHYLFLAGLIISTLAFLELNRRVILYRDPQARYRKRFWKEREQESRKPAASAAKAARLKVLDQVDPRLRGLRPGDSTRQDVLALLGQPHERTIFLEMEAWTYNLPREKVSQTRAAPAADPLEAAAFQEDIWAGPDQKQEQDLVPVVILFDGNMLHDISVGAIKDKNNLRRML